MPVGQRIEPKGAKELYDKIVESSPGEEKTFFTAVRKSISTAFEYFTIIF
jgi:hypothetical protein